MLKWLIYLYVLFDIGSILMIPCGLKSVLILIVILYYRYLRKNIVHLFGTVLQDLYYFYKVLREISLIKSSAFQNYFISFVLNYFKAL
jgi:hypothetical protein